MLNPLLGTLIGMGLMMTLMSNYNNGVYDNEVAQAVQQSSGLTPSTPDGAHTPDNGQNVLDIVSKTDGLTADHPLMSQALPNISSPDVAAQTLQLVAYYARTGTVKPTDPKTIEVPTNELKNLDIQAAAYYCAAEICKMNALPEQFDLERIYNCQMQFYHGLEYRMDILIGDQRNFLYYTCEVLRTLKNGYLSIINYDVTTKPTDPNTGVRAVKPDVIQPESGEQA